MAQEWVSTTTSGHLRGRRSKDTEPELMLRKTLHAAGLRFRLHRKIAPACTPDIVFPGKKVAVFVDGDFWHGCPKHNRADNFRGPNAELWREKINKTRERDAKATVLARQSGWTVVRVWECEIRSDVATAAQRITHALS